MRLRTGAGTAGEFRSRVFVRLVVILEPDGGLIFVVLVATGDQSAAFVISVKPDSRLKTQFLNGLIGANLRLDPTRVCLILEVDVCCIPIRISPRPSLATIA